MTYYRLAYPTGTYSAWSNDYSWAVRNASFFGARIESKTFGMV